MEFQTIGAVAPSPDGKWVAWTQVRAVMEKDISEHVSQIWIGKADGSKRLQLTRGEKTATNPAWSPDGKWLYFLSPRFGKNDIFRIPLEGGEPERITKSVGGVKSLSVSKDGKLIAYTTVEPLPGEEAAIQEKRDWHVVDTKPHNAWLFVVGAAETDRKPRALTHADRNVIEIAWSPDGGKIAFVYWATPMVNDWRKAKLAEADVASGAVKEIAAVRQCHIPVLRGWRSTTAPMAQRANWPPPRMSNRSSSVGVPIARRF
jgi:Tol biopolymer transport system component